MKKFKAHRRRSKWVTHSRGQKFFGSEEKGSKVASAHAIVKDLMEGTVPELK